MTTAPSLVRRTIGYLIISQIAAFVTGWSISTGLGLAGLRRYDLSLDELAVTRSGDLVNESLVLDKEGAVRIEPSSGLSDEMARNPKLKFAVFDFVTREPVPGSSPELVATLAKIIDISSEHAHFVLPGDPPSPPLGFMGMRQTPFGRKHIATYGLKFRWKDILYSIRTEFVWFVYYVAAAVLMSAGTAWIAVRGGLTPLRGIVGKVAQIDMNSLDQRLEVNDAPVEIIPLVDAINEALTRLDAGVERQRRFTANAAHELRTPLAVIRARLENLRGSSLKNELLVETSQLQSAVEQLLISARLTEGQARLDEDVDLGKTAKEVVENLLPLAIDRDRFIDFIGSSTPVIVRGNRRAIESVITNLIDNALRAEPKGGSVIVRVRDDEVVEIVDHGVGIAEDDYQNVFEAFWRKDETTPGTGLGLAIAKEIVNAHDGRIWIEKTPGGGATFKLSLPALDTK